jgi:hypothetical protein
MRHSWRRQGCCRIRSFAEERPLCVMVRATLERMLAPNTIDAPFRDHAQRQYEHDRAEDGAGRASDSTKKRPPLTPGPSPTAM